MSYLVTILAVKEYPTQLNDLRRILCHIYAMLVAGCGNMDDHISIQLRDGHAVAGHAGEFDRGKRMVLEGFQKAAFKCQCQTCSEYSILLRGRGYGWMWRQTYFNGSSRSSRPFGNE